MLKGLFLDFGDIKSTFLFVFYIKKIVTRIIKEQIVKSIIKKNFDYLVSGSAGKSSENI